MTKFIKYLHDLIIIYFTQRTIVAGKLAVGTAGFKRHSTNTARIVIGYPAPLCYSKHIYNGNNNFILFKTFKKSIIRTNCTQIVCQQQYF